MRTIKFILTICTAFALLNACDESSFLEEKPLDFYTPDNSMQTSAHFQASVNFLYNQVRYIYWEMNPDTKNALYYATDFAFNATDYYKPAKLNDYRATMVPTFSVVDAIWSINYKIIANANIILDRLPAAEKVSEENKKVFRGEALFFRAYAYRFLGHLYGGVPLTLHEIKIPQRDHVRASRNEVYEQCRADLEEAAQLLPDIDKVKDGKVNRQVAQHLLSEIYISLKMYDKAIKASTAVIDYPGVALMTERFGSQKDKDGDVYGDLFRLHNQNRTSGNTEGLYVLQYDHLNAGSKKSSNLNWSLIPFYVNIQISEKNGAGETIKNSAFAGPTDMKGGRCVGWMQPTNHFITEIWKKGSGYDIRNSVHNIVRDIKIDNPQSPAYGKWLVKDGYYKQLDSIRQWYPILTKLFSYRDYPDDIKAKSSNGEFIKTGFGEFVLLTTVQGGFKDEYAFRLAETYLLRAEAQLGLGNTTEAANDINIIRDRSKATQVSASEVDMDYILDERLRELYGEELRMVTLTRLGKLVDRNKKYNPKTGKSIDDHHNLWPIPYAEIERNTEAKLEQNPGYN